MKNLYWIDINYACFGIVTDNNIIVEAPPIANWMKGKNIKEVLPWIKKRNGKMKVKSL